ncbi:hypothetical protein [Sporomusa sp.]|uniref:hypothetical protein n=1 Tax=Sporomusa sp. TaxID=2078658 RepID=UPI002C6218C8|nr:hypothetical protein [Sporomusa sp.]HWR07431.1 hypothetical protein [Sporomusa sp.]
MIFSQQKAVQGFALNTNEPPPAELAWEEVRKQLDPYKAPTWSHPAIERAVRALGFRNLCFTTTPGQDMARFIKVYEAYRQREIDQVENESIRQLTTSVIQQLTGGAA